MSERHTVRTTCNRDCPDACGIVATVEDGKIVQLQGDPDHPVTKGFLCYRTSHFLTRQYAPDRVTRPMLRGPNGFEPTTWDDALDRIAAKFKTILAEDGPAAIFHYQSGGSLGALKALCGYFFEELGPCTVKRGDICTGALDFAQSKDFGDTDSNAIEDLDNARSILIWGKNVYTSSPHTLPFLQRAQKRGVRMLLVDPIPHRTAKLCQERVVPRPGGDFALALAVGRRVFERGLEHEDARTFCDHVDEYRTLCFERELDALCTDADVTPADVERIVDVLADGPCTVLVGWGMARRDNGAAIVRAVDALGAITGNIGVPGASVSYYFHRKRAFDRSFKGNKPPPRTVSEARFGPELIEKPVRALWVTAGNPVAMLPDSETVQRAIEQTEFVVVVDSWMSDTAQLADLVLPVATLLEDDDVLGAYGHHYLAVSRPVVPPLGEARTDLEILRDLAPRVGMPGLLDDDARTWKRKMVEGKLAPHGVRLEDLEAGAVQNPLAPKVAYAGRVFPTESGRVQLVHRAELGALAAQPARLPSAAFPLTLLAVSTPRSQSSQSVSFDEGPPDARVHPTSAAGFAEHDIVRLVSAVSSMPVRLVFEEGLHPSALWMDKGGHLDVDRAANKLIVARETDEGEGASLYDEGVRLEPL